MKKKIIIIGAIAVFIIIAASVAGVWAYGEAQNQIPDTIEESQAESIPEEPSIIIDESDKVVQIWINNDLTVQEKMKRCEDDYIKTGAMMVMWNREAQKYIGYNGNDSYIEYLMNNKTSYLCLNAGLKSLDGETSYDIFLAPIEVSDGVAKFVVFRIVKIIGGTKLVFDKHTQTIRDLTEYEVKYYDPNFEFDFHAFPDKEAMIDGFKSEIATFEFSYSKYHFPDEVCTKIEK